MLLVAYAVHTAIDITTPIYHTEATSILTDYFSYPECLSIKVRGRREGGLQFT